MNSQSTVVSFEFFHELQTPNEDCFTKIFWAWANKFWGIWGIFGQTISTYFGTVSLLPVFSIIQTLFLQKNLAFISTSQLFIWDWDFDLNLGAKN